jgi:hypothetical protein
VQVGKGKRRRKRLNFSQKKKFDAGGALFRETIWQNIL